MNLTVYHARYIKAGQRSKEKLLQYFFESGLKPHPAPTPKGRTNEQFQIKFRLNFHFYLALDLWELRWFLFVCVANLHKWHNSVFIFFMKWREWCPQFRCCCFWTNMWDRIRPPLIFLPRTGRIFLSNSLAIWAELDQFAEATKLISKTEVAWNDYQKRRNTLFHLPFLTVWFQYSCCWTEQDQARV